MLVGPSGCGKSTTLRMIAGLEDITGGTIEIGGEVVNEREPKERNIAMVFQNYAIYPHMTVRQNIGFGLYTSKLPQGGEGRSASTRPARMLGLEELLDRRPAALSGGQRQRVAIGRAMVRNPVGLPVRRAAFQPRRAAARPDAHRDQAVCTSGSAPRSSTSPTTRSRR